MREAPAWGWSNKADAYPGQLSGGAAAAGGDRPGLAMEPGDAVRRGHHRLDPELVGEVLR